MRLRLRLVLFRSARAEIRPQSGRPYMATQQWHTVPSGLRMNLGVTDIRSSAVLQKSNDQLRRFDRDRHLRIGGTRCQVRGVHDIRQAKQRMIGRRRFLLVDIECRARNFAASQRLRQIS